MIAQRSTKQMNHMVVQEAMTILQQFRTTRMTAQRWVCEVCGMIHNEKSATCESCGASHLVQFNDTRHEIGSRW